MVISQELLFLTYIKWQMLVYVYLVICKCVLSPLRMSYKLCLPQRWVQLCC